MKFLGLIALISLTGPQLYAADPTIQFELYSWTSGPDWRYSLWEGTATLRSPKAIRSPQATLQNITYLKGRLASLPAGDKVYWREDKRHGFILPNKETIRLLKEFTEGAQVDLLTPDDINVK